MGGDKVGSDWWSSWRAPLGRRCLSGVTEASGVGPLWPGGGTGPSAPCLETHSLDLAPGRAAPKVGEGPRLCCPQQGEQSRVGPSSLGAKGGGWRGTEWERQLQSCAASWWTVTSGSRRGYAAGPATLPSSTRVLDRWPSPGIGGRGGRARPSPQPTLPHGPRMQVTHLQWG